MCGLFGFSYYGHTPLKNLSSLTNALASESAIRGTDATGIAYTKNHVIQTIKEAKAAYKMKFQHSDDTVALIGHTRHSTHGSEKKNWNNHPFGGKTKNANFALAHNGVLTNDQKLRKALSLPKTKIETDSYIAVQLIEKKKQVDITSIRYMAEQIEGSFSFSILDDENNLYLVKGDSPLSILHFPKRKIFVYASTDEILFKALVDSPLFEDLIGKNYEQMPITEGMILKIMPNGQLEQSEFQYKDYYGMSWWEYDFNSGKRTTTPNEEYINDLKMCALYQGFTSEEVDYLLKEGWTFEDIEEYIYAC
jgi:predicted glutamine amidotransferase